MWSKHYINVQFQLRTLIAMAVKQILILLVVLAVIKAETFEAEDEEKFDFLTQPRHFCGEELSRSFRFYCDPIVQEKVIGKRLRVVQASQSANRSISAKATAKQTETNRIVRSTRGIISECCRRQCAPIQMIKYCPTPKKNYV